MLLLLSIWSKYHCKIVVVIVNIVKYFIIFSIGLPELKSISGMVVAGLPENSESVSE